MPVYVSEPGSVDLWLTDPGAIHCFLWGLSVKRERILPREVEAKDPANEHVLVFSICLTA